MRKIIFVMLLLVSAISFATPASAFGFGVDHNGNAAIVFDFSAGQKNQYYEPRPAPRPRHQWPSGNQHHQPQYDYALPTLPPGWVFKNSFERSGGHCGRIANIQGEWICRPE